MNITAKNLVIILVLMMMLTLVACRTHSQGLSLDANNVAKIELLFSRHPEMGNLNEQVWFESRCIINGEIMGMYMAVINTYTDENHISALISFFNSLTLTPSEIFVDTARPPINIKVTYHDGTIDFIRFHFTSLFHNDSFFRISDNDRGLERTRELDDMLYGLHDETKRLR